MLNLSGINGKYTTSNNSGHYTSFTPSKKENKEKNTLDNLFRTNKGYNPSSQKKDWKLNQILNK